MKTDMAKPRATTPVATTDGNRCRLRDLAGIIRSKNAGPFRITFDILFDDAAGYRAACDSGVFTPQSIARLYGIPVTQISSLYQFPKAHAIKITMVRPRPQCSIGESDVYGAQQHAPLLDLEIPLGTTQETAE